MTAAMDDLEKRLTQLKREVPTRGLERHPSVLKNISDLPPDLQSPAVTALASSIAIQTIIVFPPQIHRGWDYVPKQALLFSPADVICLMASVWPDQEPQIRHIKGGGIMYVRVSMILLYGLLEILAQGSGSPTRVNVEFNTVAWYLLAPPVRLLLQATKAISGTQIGQSSYSQDIQQALDKLPLKFSNGVSLYGVLPGELLEALVFQRGTWERWLLLIRRPISANTLLLLTSNYMVVIQEDLKTRYGWIISYLPRDSIAGMQNQACGEWNEVTVQLKRGRQTATYTLQLKREVAEVWGERWVQHGGQWQDLPGEAKKPSW